MNKSPLVWDRALSLLLFIVGIRLGIRFPDMDQRLPFLLHRSLLTHGFLLAGLFFMLIRRHSHQPIRFFVIGFCLSSTIHLCFDLFPRSWRGFALIWVPFYGRTGTQFSQVWMGLSCVLCLYLAALLIKQALEILLSGLGAVLTFVLNSAGEHSVGLSLLVFLVAAAIVLTLPSPARTIPRAMSRATDEAI